jgi:L-ascorbate oxidase
MYAGERFDIIVEMDQMVDNYWIRFKGLLDCGPDYKSIYQVAVLRYDGAPETDPNVEMSYNYPPPEQWKPVL